MEDHILLLLLLLLLLLQLPVVFEPPQDKTNKMACAPSENSDQPGHPQQSFCWVCHEAAHLVLLCGDSGVDLFWRCSMVVCFCARPQRIFPYFIVWQRFVCCKNPTISYAEGIANSVDPDQTAPLHCLPRPGCPKNYGSSVLPDFVITSFRKERAGHFALCLFLAYPTGLCTSLM